MFNWFINRQTNKSNPSNIMNSIIRGASSQFRKRLVWTTRSIAPAVLDGKVSLPSSPLSPPPPPSPSSRCFFSSDDDVKDEKIKLKSNGNKNGTTTFNNKSQNRLVGVNADLKNEQINLRALMGKSLQPPAGRLWSDDDIIEDDDEHYAGSDRLFIPQISLHENDGRSRKRVLVLCTGGTLTMAPDPALGGALAPVEGALSQYMSEMSELQAPNMPEVVLHEYSPFYDSSDLGPADWARLASDIKANYLHFDGFVVVTGTDTMAYFATALR